MCQTLSCSSSDNSSRTGLGCQCNSRRRLHPGHACVRKFSDGTTSRHGKAATSKAPWVFLRHHFQTATLGCKSVDDLIGLGLLPLLLRRIKMSCTGDGYAKYNQHRSANDTPLGEEAKYTVGGSVRHFGWGCLEPFDNLWPLWSHMAMQEGAGSTAPKVARRREGTKPQAAVSCSML